MWLIDTFRPLPGGGPADWAPLVVVLAGLVVVTALLAVVDRLRRRPAKPAFRPAAPGEHLHTAA
jgi:hypothetical protein